jgi:hypothetical protein
MKKDGTQEEPAPKPKKMKKVYTIRDVIIYNHRDLIEAENPMLPGDAKYIGSYQQAVKKVQENMDEDELSELGKTADLWTKEGAPADQVLK